MLSMSCLEKYLAYKMVLNYWDEMLNKVSIWISIYLPTLHTKESVINLAKYDKA